MIHSNGEGLILLRLGAEVSIKSRRTRSSFLRRLVRNLRDAGRSGDSPYEVDAEWSRVFVRATSPDAPLVLARVFGISSYSPVEAVVPAELEEIERVGESVFRDRVAGRTFAVRARRTGHHPFTSQDVQVRLGAALLPYSAGVRLDQPEATVHVEVRGREAYLFGERVPGSGGLPVGVEGRAVALLSGGYDSAVAAWLMLKRGIALDYVFCNLGGDAYERAVVQVGKVLADDWSYGYRPRLHVIDFGGVVTELKERCKPAYWQVVLKRLMYRVADAIGERIGANAIVTGEAVGQVSSQTLSNLRAIGPAAQLPLFRPLLGYDKEEIIEKAHWIGTAALSEQVKEYCAIAPGKPVTAARTEAVAAEEAKLDPQVLSYAIGAGKVIDLRKLTPTDLVAPYLFTAEVPAGAAVLDCRPEPQYRAWHYPGAEHRDEWELLQHFRELDRDRTYVIYCAHGIQSAYLAERMQRAGYEAYSFKGGVGQLMRYVQGNPPGRS
jgi:thiamine biosynthesis protein ThiI